MATLEREIDRLYALPLDEFTARRNELAKRLKKDGEEDAAEQVTALVKPSVPAWTINQLARRQKKEVQALLTTGTRLRKAQERALAGGGADALNAAQAEERESVRDLTQRAVEILEEAGRPATRAVLERIRATLGAAVLTDPERAALKAGRLTTEVQVSGFDALAGIRPAPPKSRAPGRARGAPGEEGRARAGARSAGKARARAGRPAQRKPRRPPSAPKKLLRMRESSPTSADGPRTWPPTSSPRSSRTPARALAAVLATPRVPQLWMVGERLRIAAAVPGVGEETLDAARLPAVDDRLQLRG